MARFIPGLQLNRLFYHEVIQQLLKVYFPKLKYSAALAGNGSDVLGFDTETSMDHYWGPRGLLFFSESDYSRVKADVDGMFRKRLPYGFKGFPTNFTPSKHRYIIKPMKSVSRGAVNHMIQFFTIRAFFEHFLGFNPYRKIFQKDWLTFPQQSLLEVTGGEVFYDGLAELIKIRGKFAFYPHNVWLYLLRSQWAKIADEISFQARSGEEGDELGSQILASRMAENIMRMAFLMEKKYAPYSKWFGAAFLRLKSSEELTPFLMTALNSIDWRERQECLGGALQALGRMHNKLRITSPQPTKLEDFYGRGYTVLDVGRYITAIDRRIENPKLKKMKYPIGGIDQFIGHSHINRIDYIHRKMRSLIE